MLLISFGLYVFCCLLCAKVSHKSLFNPLSNAKGGASGG